MLDSGNARGANFRRVIGGKEQGVRMKILLRMIIKLKLKHK
jgi:hypothetical protein